MHGQPTSLIDLTPHRDGSMSLLCLPYAGGGSSAFNAWPRSLPADVKVLSARLPGRESRLLEPPYRTLTAVVGALVGEVAALATAPYAVFGHSMGALVGYELVRGLRAAGLPEPHGLVVSGHTAPHRGQADRPLHLLPDSEFLDTLRGYGGIPEALLSEPRLMELFLPTLRADFAVVETYTHLPGSPLSCPIAVFGGDRDGDVPPAALRAWAELTTGRCTRRTFPGGHFFIHEARDLVLAELGRILRPAGQEHRAAA